MKKTIKALAALAVSTVLFASCTTTRPITATSNPVGNKCGEASVIRIFGLGGSGNNGINKAAKNGGITKISHIDYVTSNYLGIVLINTTVVYGE